MTGLEGIAWERNIAFADDRLIVDRQTHESGHFFFPWRNKAGLEFMLGTTSLREGQGDYQLEVELARGTLHRLRTYLAERSQQFKLSQSYTDQLTEAHEHLLEAVLSWRQDPQFAGTAASKAIEICLGMINQISVEDADHLMEARHQAGMANPLFGIKLGEMPQAPKEQQELSL
ncbi:MAG TPA: hypothetical protein DEP12_04265, partial [Planctomycetaceae bacterium]|nr:hypothetical protein [Planctomycetaceae bacterium]